MCIKFEFPGIFYEFQLFEPQYFASSMFWPSLGDALLNIIIIIWVVYEMFYYSKKVKFKKDIKVSNIIPALPGEQEQMAEIETKKYVDKQGKEKIGEAEETVQGTNIQSF